MDKDRENLIDNMFEYYDNEDFGNTTVLSPAGNSDDTQVIDTGRVTSHTDTDSHLMEETVQLEVPITRRAPAEETLGNMDREGHIIEPPPQTYVRRVSQNPYDDIDIPRTRRQTTTQIPKRPTSVWYKLKPLWVTVMATFVLIGAFKFYMTETGIIGTYKRNFSYNMSLIMRAFGWESEQPAEIDEIEAFEEYIGETEFTGASNPFSDFMSATGFSITAYAESSNDTPRYDESYKKIASLPFSGAGDAKFCEYGDGFVCAKPNYICYITKKGDLKWESSTSISQPILSVAGKYIAVAGKDSTHLNLYKNNEPVYTVELNDAIKSCSVSEKGDVVLVTEKTAYKGAVVVYNSKGEEVFSWVSGVNYITSASIAKNRSVSVSLISTEDKLTSYVMIFDIYSSDPIGGSEFSNTLIYDLTSHKNITYAYGDNSISAVKDDGETKHNVVFDNMEITHTSCDGNGWRGVSYTDNYLPYINIYNPNGKLRYSIPTESSPEYIDIFKSIVLYNNGRDIICGKATDGSKNLYRAPMSVKNLMMLSKNTYLVVYENSIELIKI